MNAPNQKPQPKPRVVLDTSVWLTACASKQLGDNMSELDLQYREKGLANNPDKMRGILVDALVNKRVIVPDTILKELQGLASAGAAEKHSGKRPRLNDDNVRNIRALTNALENRTTKIPVTREAAALQKEVWDEIKEHAKTDPALKKTWDKKFSDHETAVRTQAKKAEENQLEPWIHAKNRMEELRMANVKSPSEKNRREINELRVLVKDTEPTLVPDFEIMLCAIATQSEMISFDKDFAVMWAALPETIKAAYPASTPKIGQRVNDTAGEPKTPDALAKAVADRVNPFVVKKPGPTIE